MKQVILEKLTKVTKEKVEYPNMFLKNLPQKCCKSKSSLSDISFLKNS